VQSRSRVTIAGSCAGTARTGLIGASAFIPLLEVLPEHRREGIGSELVRRILAELQDFYMVDLVCDPELEPFYRRFEMMLLSGMGLRRRHLLEP